MTLICWTQDCMPSISDQNMFIMEMNYIQQIILQETGFVLKATLCPKHLPMDRFSVMLRVRVSIPLGENKTVVCLVISKQKGKRAYGCIDSLKTGVKKRYESKLKAVQLNKYPYRLPAEIGIDDSTKF